MAYVANMTVVQVYAIMKTIKSLLTFLPKSICDYIVCFSIMRVKYFEFNVF